MSRSDSGSPTRLCKVSNSTESAVLAKSLWRLYGHAPLMAELGAGDVVVHGGPKSESAGEAGGTNGESRYNVSWGFAEVLGDRVTILASDALKPEEIDLPRAQEQLARGHKQWDEAGDSEAAFTEALRVIAEAEAKIASAAEKH